MTAEPQADTSKPGPHKQTAKTVPPTDSDGNVETASSAPSTSKPKPRKRTVKSTLTVNSSDDTRSAPKTATPSDTTVPTPAGTGTSYFKVNANNIPTAEFSAGSEASSAPPSRESSFDHTAAMEKIIYVCETATNLPPGATFPPEMFKITPERIAWAAAAGEPLPLQQHDHTSFVRMIREKYDKDIEKARFLGQLPRPRISPFHPSCYLMDGPYAGPFNPLHSTPPVLRSPSPETAPPRSAHGPTYGYVLDYSRLTLHSLTTFNRTDMDPYTFMDLEAQGYIEVDEDDVMADSEKIARSTESSSSSSSSSDSNSSSESSSDSDSSSESDEDVPATQTTVGRLENRKRPADTSGPDVEDLPPSAKKPRTASSSPRYSLRVKDKAADLGLAEARPASLLSLPPSGGSKRGRLQGRGGGSHRGGSTSSGHKALGSGIQSGLASGVQGGSGSGQNRNEQSRRGRGFGKNRKGKGRAS